VVISSESEGLSNVMLEAMAHGIPVISTPVSGAKDAIDHGKNGYISNDFTSESIQDHIIKFQNLSPEQKHLMGLAAHNTIKSEFAIDKTAEKYIRLL